MKRPIRPALDIGNGDAPYNAIRTTEGYLFVRFKLERADHLFRGLLERRESYDARSRIERYLLQVASLVLVTIHGERWRR
jgi:hypothetical protein